MTSKKARPVTARPAPPKIARPASAVEETTKIAPNQIIQETKQEEEEEEFFIIAEDSAPISVRNELIFVSD